MQMCKISHTRMHAKCVRCACRCGYWYFFEKKMQICVQKCKRAKFRTSARVRSVCDVRASMVGWVIFEIFEKMCAKVQMCEISHVRTRAKCVRCACKCGGRRLFWKFLKKCVQKCECAKIRTSAHPHTCEMCVMCKGVQSGASGSVGVRPNIHTNHVLTLKDLKIPSH